MLSRASPHCLRLLRVSADSEAVHRMGLMAEAENLYLYEGVPSCNGLKTFTFRIHAWENCKIT